MKSIAHTVISLMVVATCLCQFTLVNTETPCIRERRRALVAVKKHVEKCQKSGPSVGCQVKCVLEKEQILGTDGMVTKELFTEAVKKRATGEQIDRMLTVFDECMEEYGSSILPNDDQCEGYLNLGLCLKTGVEDLCASTATSSEQETSAAKSDKEEDTKKEKEEL